MFHLQYDTRRKQGIPKLVLMIFNYNEVLLDNGLKAETLEVKLKQVKSKDSNKTLLVIRLVLTKNSNIKYNLLYFNI